MAIPMARSKIKELLTIYRAAWRAAGRPGKGRIMVGGFEIASLQVNFDVISLADAERSIRLFSRKLMPAFA